MWLSRGNAILRQTERSLYSIDSITTVTKSIRTMCEFWPHNYFSNLSNLDSDQRTNYFYAEADLRYIELGEQKLP